MICLYIENSYQKQKTKDVGCIRPDNIITAEFNVCLICWRAKGKTLQGFPGQLGNDGGRLVPRTP